MKMPEHLKNFIDWYIKGYYHCDHCPYSWEERGLEDGDAGCYIKGEICDTCRLIQPFKGIIGRMRKNRYEYWESKRYEGYGEWYEEEEKSRKRLITYSRNFVRSVKAVGFGEMPAKSAIAYKE